MTSLQLGSSGPAVTALQQQLEERGFDPGATDGQFGAGTDTALRAFQTSVGLTADGEAGPNTIAALTLPAVISNVTLDLVAPLFPATPRANIQFHLPFILKALLNATLADKDMVLMALATIRAETAGFVPIEEGISQYNTTPGGPHPFDKYDYDTELGNQGPLDGANFKGRGFVQLTGRYNYTKFSPLIGLGDTLVQNPALANDPDIAARILAAFLGAEASQIRQALQIPDLAKARKLVNGGTNGLDAFEAAFQTGQGLIPDPVQVQVT